MKPGLQKMKSNSQTRFKSSEPAISLLIKPGLRVKYNSNRDGNGTHKTENIWGRWKREEEIGGLGISQGWHGNMFTQVVRKKEKRIVLSESYVANLSLYPGRSKLPFSLQVEYYTTIYVVGILLRAARKIQVAWRYRRRRLQRLYTAQSSYSL
ncbi:hypothetical protein YC2023_083131 [Brassica napus]